MDRHKKYFTYIQRNMEIPKNIHPVNYIPKVLPIIIVQDFHGHQALPPAHKTSQVDE